MKENLREYLRNLNKKDFIYLEYPGIILICYAFSHKKPIVLIWEKKEKERIFEDLHFFFKDVRLFEDEKEISSIISRRNFDCLVLTDDEIEREIFKTETIMVKKDEKISYNDFIKFLVDNSFTKTERVFQKGEFSTRGFIIDIFPFEESQPFRIELDNDRVSSIRKFDVFTNRSFELLDFINISGVKKEKVRLKEILDDFTIISREIKGIKSDIKITQYGFRLPFSPAPNFNRDLNLLRRFLNEKRDYNITIVLESQGEIDRMKEILEDYDITFKSGHLSKGFIIEDIKEIFITESDIFGFARVMSEKIEIPEYDIDDFKEGDYVVHEDFGIGIFEGLKYEEIHGKYLEFLKVKFGSKDEVLVPVDKIYLIKRYIGKDKPEILPISKSRWEKKKEKIKENLKEIARDMLNLYAKRKSSKGFKFSPDTIEQKEMEALFPYEETEDQMKAISEIKKDMENDSPMERLLCGEVGYGKTEVALRAAFKAVMDSKQVAILAPTTILAEQHYLTFKNRLKDYPVNIELLSRFTKRTEKEIIRRIEDGSVDIVIGTHRILSKDIKFKDLGLLIVDEEQRFGVRQKDKIKKMKENIDFLSMSATPIPRTMNMALYGIMDLSVIETPPPGRMSVITEIIKWDDEVIRDIIMRENERGGQVFFVHNRIETIMNIRRKLEDILPDMKICVAHGRMRSNELERIMIDFIHKKYDILLSTAIIESGLDIPNANTIIINDAHKFGLADLHQLRGRVGRSLRRGFCYLIVPRWISPDAMKRVSAIKNYSYLGAGFKIALLDLEIRGAGTILGLRQHGFIDDVGYDMFEKLLEEAIGEIRGEKMGRLMRTEVILKKTLFIPKEYISNEDERIKIYRKLFNAKSESDLDDLRRYVEDVYGKMPEEMKRIFYWLSIKIKCERKMVSKIEEIEDGFSLKIEKKIEKNLIREIVRKVRIKRFSLKDGIEVVLENEKEIEKFLEVI
uniref:Transcription-repair-coupling factor n=1 Tax=candidate division WOR-3 bacterium TaxID=2052148 RepID=A0A7C4U7V0_UNCW3